VGIGTSSPNEMMTIASSSVASYLQICDSSTGSTSGDGLFLGSFNGAAELRTKENTHLSFGTNNTQHMRIDSSGNVMIPGSSLLSSSILSVDGSGNVANGIASKVNDNAYWTYVGINPTGTNTFLVYGDGDVENTNNSYGAISDVKLKENIVDTTPKLDDLKQVRIVNYNLIENPDKKLLGVIAQELEQIFPNIVSETPDFDDEGNDLGTTTKSVKYSVFVPMLIKAMQEQQAIIESQQSQIDALTARIEALEATP